MQTHISDIVVPQQQQQQLHLLQKVKLTADTNFGGKLVRELASTRIVPAFFPTPSLREPHLSRSGGDGDGDGDGGDGLMINNPREIPICGRASTTAKTIMKPSPTGGTEGGGRRLCNTKWTTSLLIIVVTLQVAIVSANNKDVEDNSNWRSSRDDKEAKSKSHFFALRGRRDGLNHLLRGKRSELVYKKDQFDHLLRGKKSSSLVSAVASAFERGRKAQEFDHFLRGRRTQEFDHFLRGRRAEDFHRILRGENVNHLLRGKKKMTTAHDANEVGEEDYNSYK